ncbi:MULTISPECIES: cell wall hydrolase [unclassified Sphingopyxis]|uniref:cell wall hydrolase n=1 Tax=unclassified Sphingopyxis TaxID=2614943 RepID=UPI0007315606|nr:MULTISPECIES: cell wall hydrolase [unclassified Sphingopyxis]KTE27194.1 hydrolase [Sphingopyxis sp. H057]KTE54500.1 hydrolase [Sphingopyxis sp. H073]KTE56821.1 hydrolase [Sphingopyxis sp. H071]KTE58111.1 hydrolase [Sphingopyxis sp. H107]KTE68059.1 hydrolase [Sphingopyxis sp. H100]
MSRILNVAGMAAVGMTAVAALSLAEPGFASDLATSANLPAITLPLADTTATEPPADLPTEAQTPVEPTPEIKDESTVEPKAVPLDVDTLAELVAATPRPADLDDELRCLAGAVYFESRGESLAGQLAVAHVVINRAKSGRFPKSLCGVVHQPSQFSFVRGGRMPAMRQGTQWNNAVAIAQIAREGSWKNQAPGALFFHARYVSPGWRKTRVAAIDNHIFYR